MHSRHFQVVAASLVCIGMVSAQSPEAAPMKLSFGIYSFRKATEVWKQFQAATLALSKALTAELGQPVSIELNVTKTYEECLERFVAGKIDVVRFGPASYVLAKRREPGISLLAAEREDSRGVGLIVVRADSKIAKLGDLVGKRFAFGDEQSTVGRYLAQAELVDAGVRGGSLASFKFLERHDIVFKSVEIGDYEAGALHADTFKEMNPKAKHQLRVLHSFDNIGKPWLARAGLPRQIAEALSKSLQALEDDAALKALKVPGFSPVRDSDFDFVRRGMEKSAQFLLSPEASPAPAKG